MSEDMGARETRTRAAGVAASAASQPYGVEQQVIHRVSEGNPGRELEKRTCFGHLVQNGAFGAVYFYSRSHVTLYRFGLCDYRVIPVTMPHLRILKKMVRFGGFWCMPGAKPSKFDEFRGSACQLMHHGCIKRLGVWCMVRMVMHRRFFYRELDL